MKSFAVANKKLSDLQSDTKNANKGTERGQKLIEDSLRTYGAGRSILIDKNGRIIAGNKTAENFGSIGLEDVLVVQTDGTKLVAVQRMDLDLQTDKAAQELAIADNRAGQVSLEWDIDVLKELDVDLAKFWSEDELAVLLAEKEPAELLTDEDDVPAVPDEPETVLGDVYVMGNHRLMCGDSTSITDVEKLMDGRKPDLTLTDPPYGLGDTTSIKNNYDEYLDTKENLVELIAEFLPLAMSMSGTVVITPGNGNQWLYPEPTWIMAWFTPAGTGRGPWGFCCWQPLLCYGKDPKLAKGKGCHPDAIVHTESAEKVDHPCSKPVKFWQWIIERTSEVGALIYEPFGGSGTGIISAMKCGRSCYAMELSPAYCDVIVKRWEDATGKKAERIHGETP